MSLVLPFVIVASLDVAAPAAIKGAVSVSVVDNSGAIVTDLRAEEVTLKEDGQTRVITRVERDSRPLALAVLVDSSEYLRRGFLRDLADPVVDFLESLPPGVDRTLLTIGAAPEVVSLDSWAQARVALKAKIPFGNLNLYDGIAEACARLSQKQGTRRALVVVMSDRFTEQHQQKALDAAGRAAPLVLVIQFQGAGTYAPTLDSIVQWSGGRYEQVGAASGVANSLRKLLPDLGAAG